MKTTCDRRFYFSVDVDWVRGSEAALPEIFALCDEYDLHATGPLASTPFGSTPGPGRLTSASLPSLNSDPGASLLREAKPDLLVSVGPPEILKPHVLDVPRLGELNVHNGRIPRSPGNVLGGVGRGVGGLRFYSRGGAHGGRRSAGGRGGRHSRIPKT